MPRFVIDTGDVGFSREDTMGLQLELQQVALSHVARMGTDKPFVVKFPREWYGIYLRDKLDGIADVEAQIGKQLAGLR